MMKTDMLDVKFFKMKSKKGKRGKSEVVRFCPVCGSREIVLDSSYSGIFKCKNCGYRASIFPSKKERKAQLKIQEMAFVLLAFAILASFVLLFFARFQYLSIVKQAEKIREERAIAMLHGIASLPELSCSSSSICIDKGKLEVINKSDTIKNNYKELWKSSNIKSIVIETKTKTYVVYESSDIGNFQTYLTYVPVCNHYCEFAKIKIKLILPENA